MANLYEVLTEAQHGKAIASISDEFGLTPEQTNAAVTALLPAISMGLKRSTETPEGLGHLLALMAQQPALDAAYDDPRAAFSPEARAAGNAALAEMFGSPDASRAVATQAQHLSGVTSGILKKLLPVIVGMILSSLMRSGSGRAEPQAPEPAPQQGGGGLIDILRQIFGQGQNPDAAGQAGPAQWDIPPIGDILGTDRGGTSNPRQAPPMPSEDRVPAPAGTGGDAAPGGDVLAQILRELEKGIREGRIKPVIVGPYEVDVSGKSAPKDPGQQQAPGGDILGQILRDMLGGKGGKVQLPGQASGLGSAVFGDRIETGHDIEQSQIDALQDVFDRLIGPAR